MLVLSRKKDERVIITDDRHPDDPPIEICVVHIDRGKIRLGFVAPNYVRFMRSELLHQEDARAED